MRISLLGLLAPCVFAGAAITPHPNRMVESTGILRFIRLLILNCNDFKKRTVSLKQLTSV